MTTGTAQVIGTVLLVPAALLALTAALGLLRFRDVVYRIHATTKPQTLGVALALAAAAVSLRDHSQAAILLLAVIFQVVTAPVAAHMLGRVAYRSGQLRHAQLVRDDLAEQELSPPEDECRFFD